jgi:hypothetical protein
MSKNQGKVTTTKSRFIALAKGVNEADSATVSAWLAVFREFTKNGGGSLSAFAEAFVKALKGSTQDKFTVNTVRQSISHIAWAEDNIIGGASACLSMKSLVKQRSASSDRAKPAPSKPRKVSTVTVTDTAFASALRKAGLSAEVIAIATKAVFVTK